MEQENAVVLTLTWDRRDLVDLVKYLSKYDRAQQYELLRSVKTLLDLRGIECPSDYTRMDFGPSLKGQPQSEPSSKRSEQS